jgi:hypothetical protein
VDGLKAARMRPVFVNVHVRGGRPRFAAVALRNDGDLSWKALPGLGSEEDQKDFEDLNGQGYRPVSTSGFTLDGTPQLASLWVKDGRSGWVSWAHRSPDEYQTDIDSRAKEDMRPT